MNDEHERMTVLVVGAGRTGAQVLRQLSKNPALKVVTLDPRESPHAVEKGIIENVDYREALTPLTLDHVLRERIHDVLRERPEIRPSSDHLL